MRRFRLLWLSLALALCGGIFAVSLASPSQGPLSVSVVGFTTNRLSAELVAKLNRLKYICAVVAVTNTASRTVIFAPGRPGAGYQVLVDGQSGWEEDGRPPSHSYPQKEFPIGLAVGEGFIFYAVIDPRLPCRVAFEYGVMPRSPPRVLAWLRARLSSGGLLDRGMTPRTIILHDPVLPEPRYRAVTPVIDLRSNDKRPNNSLERTSLLSRSDIG